MKRSFTNLSGESGRFFFICLALFFLSVFVVIFQGYSVNRDVTRSLKGSVYSALQPIKAILENARWPTQRYDYLRASQGGLSEEDLSGIESQVLQLTFGLSYEYFILRTLEGQTIVEIKQGGLSRSRSAINIQGFDQFDENSSGFFLRPCYVGGHSLVCLIDFPMQRDFAKGVHRTFSVVAVSLSRLAESLRGLDFQETFFGLEPKKYLKMGDQIFFIEFNEGARDRFLLRESQIEGSLISGAFNSLEELSLAVSKTFFVLLFGFLIVRRRFRRKLREKVQRELLYGQLRHADEVNQLIRSVSHDIKSPLMALKVILATESNPELRGMIHGTVSRLSGLVDDLSAKARGLEKGTARRPILPVLATLQMLTKEKERELRGQVEFQLCENEEIWISGDFSGFCRGISNLINNALEASELGSKCRIKIGLLQEKGVVRISVRDYGAGFDSDFVENVFRSGFSRNKNGGTGLGLFQVKKSVEKYGGSVSVENSKDGEGGAIVSLRYRVEKSPPWATKTGELGDFKRVVVVDDEEFAISMWLDMLSQHSFESVECFRSPKELDVANLLRQGSETIVIMDNSFEKEYSLGVEFVEKNRRLNIVMCSSSWQNEELQKVVSLYGKKLIPKELAPYLRLL